MSKLSKLILLAKAEDKEAFNKLLEIYYEEACKWAFKFINQNKYSNLIKFERSEVDSLVFDAFKKSVDQYSENREKVLSFKNFFYQMIKYRTFEEIKKHFNWQVIPHYWRIRKKFTRDLVNQRSEEEIFESKYKCKKIINFLSTKSALYADIFRCRLLGYKNPEICAKLKISNSSLKSTNQYIKKLVREEFGQFGEAL